MCDDREKLIAYLYEESNADDRRQVDEHLTGCETCREELRGLRAVRQDLLSWAVPEHESVWKAFVAPQPPVWWRQVPAWGLAAAATLVFGIGLAGGFVARALVAAPVVASAQPQPQPATPQVVSATPEQVRQLEERLASLERVSLADKSSTVSASDVVGVATLQKFEHMLKETEGRINERTSRRLVSMAIDMYKAGQRDKADLMQQISDVQAQTYGNLAKVANRGQIEKEKEQ